MVATPTADARRSTPVGLWGVENNPIKGGDDYLATRFVLDEPTTMYRFISGFNLEGVYTDEANQPAPTEIRTRYRDKRQVDGRYPPPPDDLPSGWSAGTGRWGYAHGNGGVICARLVAVKADGRPDLPRVIAQEKVNAVKRYDRAELFATPHPYFASRRSATLSLHLSLSRRRLLSRRLLPSPGRRLLPSPHRRLLRAISSAV